MGEDDDMHDSDPRDLTAGTMALFELGVVDMFVDDLWRLLYPDRTMPDRRAETLRRIRDRVLVAISAGMLDALLVPSTESESESEPPKVRHLHVVRDD